MVGSYWLEVGFRVWGSGRACVHIYIYIYIYDNAGIISVFEAFKV